MAKGRIKKKIKEALAKGEHLTAKVAMAPSRAAFLLANKVNFIRMAERLTHTYEKDPEKVKKFWYQFGGEFKNLLPEMEKGVRLRKKHEAKKAAKRGEHTTNENPTGETTPTETGTKDQISGTLGFTGYDDAAYVAAASPIIIAALKMFKKGGDKPGANSQDSSALSILKEHLLSGHTQGVEVHATDEQGNSRLVATGGGISTPILIAGAGALAIGGYFLLKKKTK